MVGESEDFKLFWADGLSTDPRVRALVSGVAGGWLPLKAKYNAAQQGPLVLAADAGWIPVLNGSRTTFTMPVNLSATPFNHLPPKAQIFQRHAPVAAPPLVAVRRWGRGRVALFNQWHMFTIGSGTKWLFDSQVSPLHGKSGQAGCSKPLMTR